MLFDDPVAASCYGKPVLWLGCEQDGEDGLRAIVVEEDGHVSLFDPGSLVTDFRHDGGRWINVSTHEEPSEAQPTTSKYPEGTLKYPEGTIFDSEGNPYTKDGDPL